MGALAGPRRAPEPALVGRRSSDAPEVGIAGQSPEPTMKQNSPGQQQTVGRLPRTNSHRRQTASTSNIRLAASNGHQRAKAETDVSAFPRIIGVAGNYTRCIKIQTNGPREQ